MTRTDQRTLGIWQISHRADPDARKIADRHYNRQKPGTPQFVPPAQCVVLNRPQALRVNSWPCPEYTKHTWAGAWVGSCFRNESQLRASDLITAGVRCTLDRWPDAPASPSDAGPVSTVTFINRERVRPTPVRGVGVWGWTWRSAWFLEIGETHGGSLAIGIRTDAVLELSPLAGSRSAA